MRFRLFAFTAKSKDKIHFVLGDKRKASALHFECLTNISAFRQFSPKSDFPLMYIHMVRVCVPLIRYEIETKRKNQFYRDLMDLSLLVSPKLILFPGSVEHWHFTESLDRPIFELNSIEYFVIIRFGKLCGSCLFFFLVLCQKIEYQMMQYLLYLRCEHAKFIALNICERVWLKPYANGYTSFDGGP